MTAEERRSAVGVLGFSERQAAFLVTVLLHAGVCVGRQYCTFARLAPGQKMRDFFQRFDKREEAFVGRFAIKLKCLSACSRTSSPQTQ